MSLTIKFINYENIRLSTIADLDVFHEELRNLLSNGFSLSVELFATNNTYSLNESIYQPSFYRKNTNGDEPTSGSTSSSKIVNL